MAQSAQRQRRYKIHSFEFLKYLGYITLIQGGELGPTLKLKRHWVLKQYEDVIEKMYF